MAMAVVSQTITTASFNCHLISTSLLGIHLEKFVDVLSLQDGLGFVLVDTF